MSNQELAQKLALAIQSLASVLNTNGALGSALQSIADVHNELIKEAPKAEE